MSSQPPILIAGGGIAGLSLALGLARRGFGSHIVERRDAFSESGAGIQISPNGVRALDVLGIRAALEPLAGRPREILVYAGASGRILQRLPLGDWIEARHGAPYLVAHRRDLQTALLDAVRREPSIHVTTGFDISGFRETGQSMRLHDAIGDAIEGRALVGADGIFSVVRQQIHPDRGPRFAGRTAARAVIPAERVQGLIDPSRTGVWLAPASHVVHYPVRGGREIAVVVIRTEIWADDPTELGWSAPLSREALLAAVVTYAPRLRQFLALAPEWRRWALFEAPPLPAQGLGGTTLIGDAAHPVLPFLAQGGALALEDAVTLACLVAEHGADITGAFRAHERLRRPRTTAIATAARRNGQIYHLGGIPAGVRDIGLSLLPARRIMAGYDWIYGWRPGG